MNNGRGAIGIAMLLMMTPAIFAGDFDMSWITVDSGGVSPVSGGEFELSGTIGQPDANVMVASGGNYELQAGFWVVVAGPPCPGDVDGSGEVDVTDLLELIAAWGPCPDPGPPCSADIDEDGEVDVADLLALIAAWGPCQ